jgi:hypothetical protein
VVELGGPPQAPGPLRCLTKSALRIFAPPSKTELEPDPPGSPTQLQLPRGGMARTRKRSLVAGFIVTRDHEQSFVLTLVADLATGIANPIAMQLARAAASPNSDC